MPSRRGTSRSGSESGSSGPFCDARAVRPGRIVVLASAALSALLLLPSCGGGGGGGSAAPATTRAPRPTPTTSVRTPTTAPAAADLDVATAPWSLPAATSRAVVLLADGVLVVLGGQDARHASVASVERIDPVAGSATQGAPLDPAVHDAAGVQRGADSIVIAGGTPPARATVQAATSGQATRTLGSLPAPRTDHVAAAVDGTIFVLGGADSDEHAIPGVVASTDGSTWSDAGTLVEPVRYPAVATLDGAVYLFGGARDGAADTTAVQRYDPERRTTEVVAQLPAPLSHASAVVLGGEVWILGGFVDDTPSAQILRFDPSSGAVTPAGDLPSAVTDAGAVATSTSTGLLVGGEGVGRATTAAVVALRAH